ncbi:MAG: cysteine desulfurase-like protein [Bacillota bacterium]
MELDVSHIRRSFPALQLQVDGRPAAFFDGPGGTQVPETVTEAQRRYLTEQNANRGGAFLTSERTDQVVSLGRERIAALLGADTDEVAFGANMTTLNFALARALGRQVQPGDEIIITDMDHEANRAPWLDLRERGAVVRSVAMNLPECTLNTDDLRDKLSHRTRIIAVGWASNAVGTIPDLRLIRELADQVDATMVVDAVHYAPHRLMDVHQLGCDFLLCSAYKFFGPHVGILYGRRESFERLHAYKVRPQSSGIPNRIETGTANFEGIAGTAAAVDFIAGVAASQPVDDLRGAIARSMTAIAEYEDGLNRVLMSGLQGIPGVHLYGPDAAAERTPTVAFTADGISPREIARRLGERGIFAWDGDFYATTLVERLGLAPSGGVVRAGLAPYSTREEVDRLLQAVEDIC